MDEREELAALRRLAELEAKAGGGSILDRSNAQRDKAEAMKGALGSDFQNLVAGYGAAVPRMARGIGQRLGLVSQAEADEANARDKPLMDNLYGATGNLAGTVGAAGPTVAIPGVNTLAGAALTGGALSYAQPTSTGESADRNASIGAVAGPVGIMGGRALGAVYQGGKALMEPLYGAGQQRIAGRVLQKFAEDPSKIAGATGVPTMTGARPLLAEQTGDRGLATLQDSLLSNPETKNALASRMAENNAARVSSLRDLTGKDGARAAAEADRSTAAEKLYREAFENQGALSPSQVKAQQGLLGGNKIEALLSTPAIAEARAAARKIAANKGTPIDDPAGSIQGLHYMKLAMDDAIEAASAKATPAGANLASSIKAAQGRLVDALETLSPGYKTARQTYAQKSKPINSMQVADELSSRGLSATNDLAGVPQIYRNGLLKAMADEPALVKAATGRNLGGLSDVMEPNDLAMLRTIAAETDRSGAVASAGAGKGSATAQRLATQNVLSRALGPLGLPGNVAESSLLQTIAKPLNLLYGQVGESKIQAALVEAMLDPAKAQAMLVSAAPAQRAALLQLFQKSAAARSAPAANLLANRP